MPVIILEGLNGAGKSHVALRLSQELCVPIYKAFRVSPDQSKEFCVDPVQLQANGIAINTFHEDVYASDFLRMAPTDVILDRSLPSGIMYGTIQDLKCDWNFLFNLWHSNMLQAKAVIIWMECEYQAAKDRINGTIPINLQQYNKMTRLGHKIFTRIQFPKMRIDTTHTTKDDTFKQVFHWIKRNWTW